MANCRLMVWTKNDMKKSDFKYDISDLIAKSDVEKEATMFPFAVGNEYHFTLSESLFSNRVELIDGVLCKWMEAITDDGVGISKATDPKE